MVSKIIFKKITFSNIDYNKFNKYISKKGLFVFPAGPALASIDDSKEYYKSIQKADFVFFDSGFFVLLLKIFKNVSVDKFSGYKFLNLFFNYLKNNNKKKIFCIDPNLNFSSSNKLYIKNLGVKQVYNYVAPKYIKKKLIDKKLLKLINKIKPNIIVINIGGGTQEVLGLYLRDKVNIKPTILCTGGAISFFTGDQAPINFFIDKYYLGWLVRLIFNPFLFFKRYLVGLKLIPMVVFNKITTIK
tara:strand:+ start:64 stop:795 length:732 start_codon:yes stop_codon:yes gene_type:complete